MAISHDMLISALSHMYLINKPVGTYTSMHVYGELGIWKNIPGHTNYNEKVYDPLVLGK